MWSPLIVFTLCSELSSTEAKEVFPSVRFPILHTTGNRCLPLINKNNIALHFLKPRSQVFSLPHSWGKERGPQERGCSSSFIQGFCCQKRWPKPLIGRKTINNRFIVGHQSAHNWSTVERTLTDYLTDKLTRLSDWIRRPQLVDCGPNIDRLFDGQINEIIGLDASPLSGIWSKVPLLYRTTPSKRQA